MAAPDKPFKDAYQQYVDAAKIAYKAGGTQEQLNKAYELYLKCAEHFWKDHDINADNLPDDNWEHYFAFTLTHSCSRPCFSPSFSCFGSLGSLGTYGTFGGCLGTAGSLGTFGTRGG
jgi:hypothetical protein